MSKKRRYWTRAAEREMKVSGAHWSSTDDSADELMVDDQGWQRHGWLIHGGDSSPVSISSTEADRPDVLSDEDLPSIGRAASPVSDGSDGVDELPTCSTGSSGTSKV